MVAIYARQSIDKQDSLSIESQIESCRRHAGEDAKIFEDKGFSGKNTNRPAFQSLIRAVEAGEIQKLYVYRMDRFSRSLSDFSRLWDLLEQYGVEFTSVTEQFDTSVPIGRAMLNIILVFAQLERETTAERVKDNYIHRFSLGAWPGGPAPYGYDITKITEDGRKVSSLTPNEKSAIVRDIFRAYVQPDASLRSIAKELTAREIPGPKRESWDSVTISRILRSPIYVQADENIYWHYLGKGVQIKQDIAAFDGVHACNGIGRRNRSKNKYNSPDAQMLTVANHEGIIDSALWLEAQDKLERNKQISRANAGKYSWLTGLIKCGKCGYAIKINYAKAEDKLYLICSGRSNLSNCDAVISVSLRELEQAVASQIQTMLDSSPPNESYPNTNSDSAALLGIEEKISRLVAALAECSDISASYISKQIDALHKEREVLLAKSAFFPPKHKSLNFSAADFSEKKVIAAEFIDRILITGDEANIVWRV